MKSSHRYGTYRGKNRIPRVLKGIILILAIVLAMSLVAYFLLKPYMIYTDNGVYISLPFFQNAATSADTVTATESQSQTPPQTETSADGGTEAQQQENTNVDQVIVETPKTLSPADGGSIHGITLSLDTLTDGTATDQLTAAGANAVIFDMKADDGKLGYVSSVSLAKAAGVSSTAKDINQAITTFNQGDYYTIARVSCFKDDALAAANSKLAINTASGKRWSDAEGIRWLNPYYSQSQTYLVNICVELAKLGFDEIVLDNCAYPTEGNLDNIKTGASYQSSAFGLLLKTFYGQVTDALKQYDVKVSLVTDTNTLTNGENSTSGQTAELLATYADRVYVADQFSSLSTFGKTLTDAGMTDGGSSLVFLCDKAPENEETPWAVFAAK